MHHDRHACHQPPARHQLHDVRERIRELRDQEQRLRAGLISGALDTVGDDYVVVFKVNPNERVARSWVDEGANSLVRGLRSPTPT